MTIELRGTQEQKDSVSAMAAQLTATLGSKIKDAHVVFKPDDKMKKRADGGPSYGFWSAGDREISLWDAIDEYPVEKTFAHEVMHVVDTDWLTAAQREAIIKLMKPSPENWKDKVIDGETMKYVSDPSEVFAVYASAAIAGFDKPAYTRMYKRSIDKSLLAELRSLIMRDQDNGDRGSTDVADVVVPPDTVEDLQEQLDNSKRKLNDAKSDLLTAQSELTDTKKALDGAKAEAKAARDQLAPTQAQLADSKSQLTAAQTDLSTAEAQATSAQAQATQATAQLAAAVAAKDAAEQGRAQAGMQLAQAKANASEIRTALAAGDTVTATAKAAEIAAL